MLKMESFKLKFDIDKLFPFCYSIAMTGGIKMGTKKSLTETKQETTLNTLLYFGCDAIKTIGVLATKPTVKPEIKTIRILESIAKDTDAPIELQEKTENDLISLEKTEQRLFYENEKLKIIACTVGLVVIFGTLGTVALVSGFKHA